MSSSKLLRGIEDVVGKGEIAHVNFGVATEKCCAGKREAKLVAM